MFTNYQTHVCVSFNNIYVTCGGPAEKNCTSLPECLWFKGDHSVETVWPNKVPVYLWYKKITQ